MSLVYPGFHFGLCPHYTLGFAGVSCLKALIMRLNSDAVALSSDKERNRNLIICLSS